MGLAEKKRPERAGNIMTLKIKEGSAKLKEAKDVRDTGKELGLDHKEGMRQT